LGKSIPLSNHRERTEEKEAICSSWRLALELACMGNEGRLPAAVFFVRFPGSWEPWLTWLGKRIKSSWIEGVAAHDAPSGHGKCFQGMIGLEGLQPVGTAGGVKAAVIAQ
jgi:hypothetical protein